MKSVKNQLIVRCFHFQIYSIATNYKFTKGNPMLKHFYLGLAMTAALSFSSQSMANITKAVSDPLTYGKKITLTSQALKREHVIDVYLPKGYEKTGQNVRYPVVYTLDGWTLSQGVNGVVSHLSNTAAMPKSIVVALHTPNIWRYLPKVEVKDSEWNLGNTPNKIDEYMTFMRDELVPYIDKNYRTNDFRVLIGMSPSAIMALHTLINEPDLFNAHYLFAAIDIFSLGYDKETDFIDTLVNHLRNNPNRKGYLYISSALSDGDDNPNQATNAAELKKRLAPFNSKNFKSKIEHIAGFKHYPMAIPGLLSAIKFSFPNDELAQFRNITKEKGNALSKIDNYYADLSKKYGYRIYPEPDLQRNVNSFRGIGYNLLGQERNKEAIEVFKRWTQLSPNEANAFDSLADAYESVGKNDLALSAHLQAVNVAKRLKDPRFEFFTQMLNDFKARVAKKSS